MKHFGPRALTSAIATVVVVTCVSGCGQALATAGAEDYPGLHMTADSDLLAPPVSETYTVTSGSQQAEFKREGTSLLSAQTTAEGLIVISDGMLADATISATIANQLDVTFTLTEPVLFERQGRLLESIVVVGSLTSDTVTFPRVRMVLHPTQTAELSRVNAVIEVPDSVTGTTVIPIDEVELQLDLERVQR